MERHSRWGELQERYPWPAERPAVGPHVAGWVVHETAWRELLDGHPDSVLLEVGAWTGKTSLWLLDRFPRLRLIAVDAWEKAGFWGIFWRQWQVEGHVSSEDTLLDLFRSNLWGHRDRAVAVRGDSLDGMRAVSAVMQPDAPAAPDVVYIDADHAYPSVEADIRCALHLFPNAVICGDDYEERRPPVNGVRQAVEEVAREQALSVHRVGRWWRYA